MSIQGSQSWFRIPDLSSFMPGFLSIERIRDGAAVVVQVGLLVAGVANGIFTVQHIAKDERLPAVTTGATCIACLSGAQLIEDLKQYRTLATQLETLDGLNQRIQARTTELESLAGVYASNSTSLTELVTRINTSVTNLETTPGIQQLPAVTGLINQAKNLLSQVQDLSSHIKDKILADVMQTLNEVKEELLRTSQANRREREALTLQQEQLRADQIKFAAMTTMAIGIAQRPDIFQQLPPDNQAFIRDYWANHTSIPLNQWNQPA